MKLKLLESFSGQEKEVHSELKRLVSKDLSFVIYDPELTVKLSA
jgi:hypothetical protein